MFSYFSVYGDAGLEDHAVDEDGFILFSDLGLQQVGEGGGLTGAGRPRHVHGAGHVGVEVLVQPLLHGGHLLTATQQLARGRGPRVKTSLDFILFVELLYAILQVCLHFIGKVEILTDIYNTSKSQYQLEKKLRELLP